MGLGQITDRQTDEVERTRRYFVDGDAFALSFSRYDRVLGTRESISRCTCVRVGSALSATSSLGFDHSGPSYVWLEKNKMYDVLESNLVG